MDVPACRTRRLVVIAVSDYGDNNADFSKGVIAQVEFVTGWLTDPDLGADRQFAAASQQTLHSVQQVRDFLHDQKLAAARRGETIVVYITGHGQLGPFSRRHYLRFAQTDDERLPGTALTTSEVIASALGSQAEHVLVMVDSCHAGALDVEVRAVLRDLGPSRHKLPSLAVVTAGDFDDKPSVGAFTQLLERALERIGAEESGFADPYLSFGEWEQVLDSISAEERDPGRVEAQWVWPPKRSRAPSPCLPNPAIAHRSISWETQCANCRMQLACSRITGETGRLGVPMRRIRAGTSPAATKRCRSWSRSCAEAMVS